MKTLLLVRHAKSDWANALLEDRDRPLNDRGKRDAPVMARRVRDKIKKIDVFLSSPAKRAAKTARIFAEAFDVKKEKIVYEEDLYMADAGAFYAAIEKTADKADTLALFSHNPGITEFANELTNARIDNIPTCGVFAIRIDTKKWSGFREAKKEFWFFDYPKAGMMNNEG